MSVDITYDMNDFKLEYIATGKKLPDVTTSGGLEVLQYIAKELCESVLENRENQAKDHTELGAMKNNIYELQNMMDSNKLEA